MMHALAEVSVDDWSPTIITSAEVADGPHLARFAQRVRSGYVAAAAAFSAPEAVIVSGRHFTVVARNSGLVAGSVHTLGRHEWHQLFFGLDRSHTYPAMDPAPLVVGNSGYQSYFHWTLESIGAILARRMLDRPPGPIVVPPHQDGWRSDLQRLFAISEPSIAVAPNELAGFDGAVLSNLTNGSFAFAPHPRLLGQFMQEALPSSRPERPRMLYIPRSDVPGRRRMENESAACDLLRSRGFTIAGMGALPVAEQAALFQAAEVVVAPHGAALTNLVYAHDGGCGPKVIELFQESYLVPTFAKIAQAKRLDYRAVINPDTTRGEHHHLGTWRCDLRLLEQAIAGS